MLPKLNPPPIKRAPLIAIGVVWSILILLAGAFNGPGGAALKTIETVETASIMTLAAFGFAAIFFGALFSAFIRDLIFESSEEFGAEFSLLLGGGVTAFMGLHFLNRVFELALPVRV